MTRILKTLTDYKKGLVFQKLREHDAYTTIVELSEKVDKHFTGAERDMVMAFVGSTWNTAIDMVERGLAYIIADEEVKVEYHCICHSCCMVWITKDIISKTCPACGKEKFESQEVFRDVTDDNC